MSNKSVRQIKFIPGNQLGLVLLYVFDSFRYLPSLTLYVRHAGESWLGRCALHRASHCPCARPHVGPERGCATHGYTLFCDAHQTTSA